MFHFLTTVKKENDIFFPPRKLHIHRMRISRKRILKWSSSKYCTNVKTPNFACLSHSCPPSHDLAHPPPPLKQLTAKISSSRKPHIIRFRRHARQQRNRTRYKSLVALISRFRNRRYPISRCQQRHKRSDKREFNRPINPIIPDREPGALK